MRTIKLLICLFYLIIVAHVNSFSQSSKEASFYIKASGGRIFFGTGDVQGPGLYFEGAKNMIKAPTRFLNKLLIGGEVSFQNGTKNPKVENPTAEEFLNTMFYHTSNFAFTAKMTYYPFKRLLGGFNVAAGPTVAYCARSFEIRAERAVYAPTVIRRMSELRFKNEMVFGYIISTGYETHLHKNWLIGMRLDLINYNNGDFNNFIGLMLGCHF